MERLNADSTSTILRPVACAKPETTDTKLSQESINHLFFEEFQTICSEYNSRLRQTKEECRSTRLEALKGGLWYPSEYMQQLEDNGCKTRLTWLKKRDCCLIGLAPKVFEQPTLESPMEYDLKTEVSPSHAIDILGHELMFVDCAISIQIGILRSLRKVLTEDQFNKLLDNRMCLSGDINKSSVSRFIKHRLFRCGMGTIGERPLYDGEVVYFSNTEHYVSKHLLGYLGGYNVAFSYVDGVQKYFGYGLEDGGFSENELNAFLVDQFNEDPCDISRFFSDKVSVSREGLVDNSELKISYNDLIKQKGGFRCGGALMIDMDAVYSLIDESNSGTN